MARTKQLPDMALATRWPHRFLDLLPASWKRGYLLRQSGGESAGEVFTLTEKLHGAKRFLISWPEKGENLLIAYPAMRVLREATGPDAVYVHLVSAGLAAAVAELFPGEQILSWSRTELAWHEPSVQAIKTSLQVFAPQVSLNLMHPVPSVLSALIKASGAGLRMALSVPGAEAGADSAALLTETEPYANVQLQAALGSPWAGHYFQFLNSWRYAGFSMQETWTAFGNDGDASGITEAWAGSNASPEQTWLYIHDVSDTSRTLDDDFYSWLWEKIQMRETEDVSIVMVVLNSIGTSLVREGRWRNVPVLKASSLSEYSSLVSPARGVAAFQGWGLHMASLAEVRCLALLRREEAAYDVSKWNPLFEVEWVA